jgi:leader peptidase (prepilin peptidase)/N-methyltransferase
VTSLLVFGFGLIIGSFLNALIWRIHSGESITKGRSKCPRCHHELGFWDLVPVVSWIFLRGRCRYCQKSIAWQYPLVELLTASLFLLSYLVLAPDGGGCINFGYWLYILSAFMVLAVYDLRWMLLPDKVTLPAIIVSLVFMAYLALSGQPLMVYLGPVIAGLAAGGAFYFLAAISKGRWMGGGDIKLVFLIGLVLGLQKTLLGLTVAFNLAAIVSLTLIASKIKKRSDHIPFGPFLITGAVVAYLYGTQIISWYLSLTAH